MPAMPLRQIGLHEKSHSCFAPDRLRIEYAVPATKPFVHFLKRDEIGFDFLDDFEDPIWTDSAVRPTALVNIVRSDLHFADDPVTQM